MEYFIFVSSRLHDPSHMKLFRYINNKPENSIHTYPPSNTYTAFSYEPPNKALENNPQ